MNSYTNEELAVFRECFILLKEGCKTSTDAEKILSRKFYDMSRTTIYKLVKHWFYNREKIDQILKEQICHTTIE